MSLSVGYMGLHFHRRTPDIIPATESEECPPPAASPTASTPAIDIPNTRLTSVDTENTRIPQSLSLGRVKLSSSFPSARPPSPYPRTRSLSTYLPPLTRVQPLGTDDHRPTTSPLGYELCEQRTPFRLPPLALQRQQNQAVMNSDHRDTDSGGGHHHKKRLHVRSRSCQIEHSGLSSVREHTVPITS